MADDAGRGGRSGRWVRRVERRERDKRRMKKHGAGVRRVLADALRKRPARRRRS